MFDKALIPGAYEAWRIASVLRGTLVKSSSLKCRVVQLLDDAAGSGGAKKWKRKRKRVVA